MPPLRLWLAVNDRRLEEAAERLPGCVVLGASRTTADLLACAASPVLAAATWWVSRYLPGEPSVADCLAHLPPTASMLVFTGPRDATGRALMLACTRLPHRRALPGRSVETRTVRNALDALRA